MPASPRFSPLPTGGFVVRGISGNWDILWNGPGSTHLFLAGRSALVPIEPDRFRVWDGTLKSAKAATRAFVAEGSALVDPDGD